MVLAGGAITGNGSLTVGSGSSAFYTNGGNIHASDALATMILRANLTYVPGNTLPLGTGSPGYLDPNNSTRLLIGGNLGMGPANRTYNIIRGNDPVYDLEITGTITTSGQRLLTWAAPADPYQRHQCLRRRGQRLRSTIVADGTFGVLSLGGTCNNTFRNGATLILDNSATQQQPALERHRGDDRRDFQGDRQRRHAHPGNVGNLPAWALFPARAPSSCKAPARGGLGHTPAFGSHTFAPDDTINFVTTTSPPTPRSPSGHNQAFSTSMPISTAATMPT